MNRLQTVLRNERGYLLLNVVFLTLITSFTAMILLNTAPRVKNPQSTLRLIAIHLANEQFAQLESLAAVNNLHGGNYPFLGVQDDLTNDSFREDNPVKFIVETQVSVNGNLRTATVTVKIDGDENFLLTMERTMRVAQ